MTERQTPSQDPCGVSGCSHCADRKPFSLPDPIIDALVSGKLVLFAGAGISTEGNRVFKSTLAQEIAAELELQDDAHLTFPQLMDVASERLGRPWILREVRKRVDYLRSFPEVYRDASRFHREIATIPFLEEIFTTNWDDLFERECGALPIVSQEDFALWEIPGRKVFKIHGSITSLGSLVLTSKDYEHSYTRLESGLVGSRLKLALATKTFLFCGYSVTDPDFRRLYEIVRKEMGGVKPAAYIITLDESRSEQFRLMDLTPIVTDAAFFFEGIKKKLVGDKIMIREENFGEVYRLLLKVGTEHRRLHEAFPIHRRPETVLAASYQDGLAHACEHVLSMATSGRLSHPCYIRASIEAYDDIRAEKLRKRRYDDVAYVDGYTNGLAYLLAPPAWRAKIPLYYVFGAGDLRSFQQYRRAARHSAALHKRAYTRAQQLVDMLPNGGKEIEYHHIAFL